MKSSPAFLIYVHVVGRADRNSDDRFVRCDNSPGPAERFSSLRKPAEHSFLSNGRAAAHAHQQKTQKSSGIFCVSIVSKFFGGAKRCGNPPSGFLSRSSTCPLVQLFPASSVSGSAATEIWPWGALSLPGVFCSSTIDRSPCTGLPILAFPVRTSIPQRGSHAANTIAGPIKRT